MTNQEEFEKKVLEQLLSGKSLFGAEGAFGLMLKRVIDKAMEAELETSLTEEKRLNSNKKYGKIPKL